LRFGVPLCADGARWTCRWKCTIVKGMSVTLETVTRDAALLPRDQRLALAKFLIELESSSSAEGGEQAWDEEIRRRVIAVEEGQVEGIPILLPEAANEFQDATSYYEKEEPGLGRRFRDEVDEHIKWIVKNWKVPRLRPGRYRRVNLKIFPFYLAYIHYEGALWVLAIAHSRREPEYWIDRQDAVGDS